MSTAAVLVPVQQADSNVESVNIASAQQRALELWNADRDVFGRSQDSATELGAALVDVKTRMPHGDYIPWLKRAGIDRNRASYCVRVVTGKHAATRTAAKKKRKVLAVDADTFLRWGDGQVFRVDGQAFSVATDEGACWVLPLTLAPHEMDEPVAPAVAADEPYDGIPKIEFDAVELNKALRRFKAINPITDARSLVDISSPATVELVGKESALRIRLPKARTFGVFEHAVDFENLVAAMKSMTGVVILMDDGTLQAGDFQTKLTWAPADAGYCFPHEEPLPDTNVDGINLARFKEQYKRIDFVLPKPEGKFVVPSALLETTSGNMRMVAADGPRLVIAEQPTRIPDGQQFCIPHPALDLIYAMGGTTLSITETPSLLIFTTELETLTYAKIHAEFPTYSKVLPPNHDGWTHITCPDSAGLAAALKRLRPFADSDKPRVVFESAADGRLALTAIKDSTPTAHAAVPILKVGPPASVGLDIKLLLPFLERVGAFECYIKDAHSGVDFHASDGYRFLLMPMRETTPTAAVEPAQEAVTA